MHEYLISDKKNKKQKKKSQRKYLKTGRKNDNYSYQTNQMMIFHIRDLANNFGMQHLKDSLIHK